MKLNADDFFDFAIALNEQPSLKSGARFMAEKYLDARVTEIFNKQFKNMELPAGKKVDIKGTKENLREYLINELRESNDICDQIFYQEILGKRNQENEAK